MSSSNYRRNKAAIDTFRKDLRAMLDDVTEIDMAVLNRSVNEGVAEAKRNTNVVSGFMRRSWRSAPAVKSKAGGATKSLVNSADYASFVNDGHRVVDSSGNTVGFVKGQFMLQKAISRVEKSMAREFKEVERVNRKHDK